MKDTWGWSFSKGLLKVTVSSLSFILCILCASPKITTKWFPKSTLPVFSPLCDLMPWISLQRKDKWGHIFLEKEIHDYAWYLEWLGVLRPPANLPSLNSWCNCSDEVSTWGYFSAWEWLWRYNNGWTLYQSSLCGGDSLFSKWVYYYR